jgi:hypothetical protein
MRVSTSYNVYRIIDEPLESPRHTLQSIHERSTPPLYSSLSTLPSAATSESQGTKVTDTHKDDCVCEVQMWSTPETCPSLTRIREPLIDAPLDGKAPLDDLLDRPDRVDAERYRTKEPLLSARGELLTL